MVIKCVFRELFEHLRLHDDCPWAVLDQVNLNRSNSNSPGPSSQVSDCELWGIILIGVQFLYLFINYHNYEYERRISTAVLYAFILFLKIRIQITIYI